MKRLREEDFDPVHPTKRSKFATVSSNAANHLAKLCEAVSEFLIPVLSYIVTSYCRAIRLPDEESCRSVIPKHVVDSLVVVNPQKISVCDARHELFLLDYHRGSLHVFSLFGGQFLRSMTKGICNFYLDEKSDFMALRVPESILLYDSSSFALLNEMSFRNERTEKWSFLLHEGRLLIFTFDDSKSKPLVRVIPDAIKSSGSSSIISELNLSLDCDAWIKWQGCINPVVERGSNTIIFARIANDKDLLVHETRLLEDQFGVKSTLIIKDLDNYYNPTPPALAYGSQLITSFNNILCIWDRDTASAIRGKHLPYETTYCDAPIDIAHNKDGDPMLLMLNQRSINEGLVTAYS